MKYIVSITFVLLAFAVTAHAEERYSMTKLSDGTVRIDYRTGAISYCRERDGNMICTIAAEERQAWIAETEALGNRIDRLENRIAALEGKGVSSTGKGNTTSKNKQDEREFDKALDFMEEAVRRFSDVFEDLKNDLKKN